jgi:hypothetical protein
VGILRRSMMTVAAIGAAAAITGESVASDGGSTWPQVTPAYSLSYDGGQTYACSPAVADGTGQLVRACAQSTGTKVCSKGW